MAITVPSEVAIPEKQLATRHPLLPTTTLEQDGHLLEKEQQLRPDTSVSSGDVFFVNRPLHLENHHNKIELTGFDFNTPWLPTNVFKLLKKLKKAPITEKQLVGLMKVVAERASAHFQLTEGAFVAMTFHGQVVEVSDTRVGLLKKIQGQKYREQIFVWRIGFDFFSGRI